MIINANTRIGAILKENPGALDAIISISPRFEKLRNPLLRKLMAGRTSISMATKMGGCTERDFFTRLAPLGFETDTTETGRAPASKAVPAFMLHLQTAQVTQLDVRPFIEAGSDPLNIIMGKVNGLPPGNILKIINSFTPEPLVLLLEKKGFESYVVSINADLAETYFYKKPGTSPVVNKPAESQENWDTVLERFKGKLTSIDVRRLEMPLPMMNILEALDKLPPGNALYVFHKRIPVFLLPELAMRKLGYRVKEVNNGEVHLLIFDDNLGPVATATNGEAHLGSSVRPGT